MPDSLWIALEYLDAGCLTDLLYLYQFIKLDEIHIAYILREVNKKTNKKNIINF